MKKPSNVISADEVAAWRRVARHVKSNGIETRDGMVIGVGLCWAIWHWSGSLELGETMKRRLITTHRIHPNTYHWEFTKKDYATRKAVCLAFARKYKPTRPTGARG